MLQKLGPSLVTSSGLKRATWWSGGTRMWRWWQADECTSLKTWECKGGRLSEDGRRWRCQNRVRPKTQRVKGDRSLESQDGLINHFVQLFLLNEDDMDWSAEEQLLERTMKNVTLLKMAAINSNSMRVYRPPFSANSIFHFQLRSNSEKSSGCNRSHADKHNKLASLQFIDFSIN